MKAPDFGRREFFRGAFVAAAGLAARTAWPFPVDKILGPGNARYIAAYLGRFEEWYGERYFRFDRAMSARELKYSLACRAVMDRWGLSLGEGNATFGHWVSSHRIEGDSVSHGRIVLGPARAAPQALESAREVLNHRGIRADLSRFFSLGWDFERDLFKIYSLHPDADSALKAEPELRALGNSPELSGAHERRLTCLVYKRNQLVDRKLIVAHRTVPHGLLTQVPFAGAVVGATRIQCLARPASWHLRLGSFDLHFLRKSGHEVAKAHSQEFAQLPFSIQWINPDRFTLYYP